MQQFDLLNFIFFNSMFLFVLFNTNFIYEYAKLLKLDNIKIFQDYTDFIYKNDFINFTTFLSFKNNFICKLVSCPLCINFWSSLFISFILKNLYIIGIIYVISIVIYFGTSILYGKYKNI
jgi:hypothetical protein